MTNGEKFNEVFPDALVWFANGNVVGVDGGTVHEWTKQEYGGGTPRHVMLWFAKEIVGLLLVIAALVAIVIIDKRKR